MPYLFDRYRARQDPHSFPTRRSSDLGFIDRYHPYGDRFKPQLLVNDRKRKMNVLTTIIDELKCSQSFIFSLAFINESGFEILKYYIYYLHMVVIIVNIMNSYNIFFIYT